MRSRSSMALALAMIVTPLLVAPACHKDDGTTNSSTSPGPMQRAGEHVDNAAHDTKEGVKEGARDTRDAAQGAATAVGSAVERAGQKMQGQ